MAKDQSEGVSTKFSGSTSTKPSVIGRLDNSTPEQSPLSAAPSGSSEKDSTGVQGPSDSAKETPLSALIAELEATVWAAREGAAAIRGKVAETINDIIPFNDEDSDARDALAELDSEFMRLRFDFFDLLLRVRGLRATAHAIEVRHG